MVALQPSLNLCSSPTENRTCLLFGGGVRFLNALLLTILVLVPIGDSHTQTKTHSLYLWHSSIFSYWIRWFHVLMFQSSSTANCFGLYLWILWYQNISDAVCFLSRVFCLVVAFSESTVKQLQMQHLLHAEVIKSVWNASDRKPHTQPINLQKELHYRTLHCLSISRQGKVSLFI